MKGRSGVPIAERFDGKNRIKRPVQACLTPSQSTRRPSGMTFTTLTFPIFLAIIFALYWSVRSGNAQNRTLLAASYIFYAWWDWRFCFLMLASSIVDFEIARRIAQTASLKKRRYLLTLSIIANLGLLGTFKYFNFFMENFTHFAAQLGWQPDVTTIALVLPLGISFYTFQTLGYTIDVYRKQVQPSKGLIEYLAFVSFFPQLVAGPIERAKTMLPQFRQQRRFDMTLASDGARQMLWGFFKKMVIADRLAVAVTPVFDDPSMYSGPHLMMATVFFAFQIYCDFSAYSDIAIGTAKLFSIELTRNFAYPYFSQSVSEFWRRWHISLSYWFRDYVYIPLGGSRTTPVRHRLNLLITFLLSGLWHGSAWRFIAWGGLNGIAVALPGLGSSKLTPPRKSQGSETSIKHNNSGTGNSSKILNQPNANQKLGSGDATPGGESFLPRPGTLLRIYSTFAILCAAWILFRATSFQDAILIYQRIFIDLVNLEAYTELTHLLDADRYQRKTAVFLLAFVCWEWVFRRDAHAFKLNRVPTALRWILYTILIWSTMYLMPKTGTGEFVYFEF